MHPIPVFFVCGAPRTGTTFLSDWISESADAYCVHEVLKQIEDKTSHELILFLKDCALTGRDRYEKLLQRKFLEWNNLHLKSNPSIIGIKEPVTWSKTKNAPNVVKRFLNDKLVKKIILFRHPIDVIASGKYRRKNTLNWPNYSVEQHCDFWLTAYQHSQEWIASGNNIHIIFWEHLLLDFEMEKNRLENYLQIKLTDFSGNEHKEEYFLQLKNSTSRKSGVVKNPNRNLLSSSELTIIKCKTLPVCKLMEYEI